MISFLKGRLIFKTDDYIVLDVNGIGFKVFLSSKNLEKLKDEENKEIRLFTFLELGEKALNIYGFLTQKELEIFEAVNSISGIGSKSALEISAFDFETIKKAIEREDIEFLEKIPGIGKKKAKKIIFEISGKILKEEKKEKTKEEKDETFWALVNLGFPKHLIKEAISKIPKEIKEPKERIKEALKILGK
jgi:Holliday junction DNA helicase RuvA